jgi:hypothetical protein
MLNRHPSALMRCARVSRAGLYGLAVLVALGCGGSNAASNPVPALSDTTTGQQAFRQLSERWHSVRVEDDKSLADDFRGYLKEFRTEDQSRLARAYLAWLDVTAGNLLEARELIEVTRRGPPGRARDFALVAEAALFVKHGHAHNALKLLRPLQGKIVDTTERYYATQQLVQSAMGANLYAEGLSHAVVWIQQAKPQQRDGVRMAIRALMTQIPTRYLEKALESAKPDPARHRAQAELVEQRWLYQVIGEQLATIAVQQKDAQLAKRVLADGTPVGPTGNRAELVRLASGTGENAAITGHTIGVVLNTNSPKARRRSSQAVTGLSIALSTTQAEVTPQDRIKVLFTDDTVDLTQGMSDLAASGASLLATGFDEEEATIAARHAARVRIPVILFVRPRVVTNYAFVIGVGDDEQRQSMNSHATPNAAVVAELECEVAAESPKATGFPIVKWVSERRTSVYLFGDAACTQRVLTEIRNTDFAPEEIWLGLESAHLLTTNPLPHSHALTAGHFPVELAVMPQAAEFAKLLGHPPTWFETLGRDLSVILTQTFDKLPRLNTSGSNEVSAYHAQVHTALSGFQSAGLWTSTESSFDDDMRLERTLTWR